MFECSKQTNYFLGLLKYLRHFITGFKKSKILLFLNVPVLLKKVGIFTKCFAWWLIYIWTNHRYFTKIGIYWCWRLEEKSDLVDCSFLVRHFWISFPFSVHLLHLVDISLACQTWASKSRSQARPYFDFFKVSSNIGYFFINT